MKNGDLWRITGISHDGGLAVTGRHGVCVLPGGYVQENVELGYAMTAHRAQGLTVDHVHALVDDTLTREVLYVAATRGRRRNQLYTVTEHLLDAEAERPADPNQPARAVLRAVLERSDAAVSATESIREEDERAASVPTQLERWRYVREHAGTDDALLDAALPAHVAAELRGDDAWPYLREVLHWRGHHAAEDLRRAYQSRTLSGADSPARVLAARLAEQPRPAGEAGDWLPVGGVDAYSDALIAAARDRAAELGARTARERPAWSSALGPVPADPDKREEWQHRAGMIAAYREAHDITSREPLGPEPADPLHRELWNRARTALPALQPDQPEAGRPYGDLSVEDLQTRLVDTERLAARAERRLQAARSAEQAAAAGGGDGPRTQQVDRDVATWTATLERLDQAEERAAAARQAAGEAAELSARLEQLEAHPLRRREREQWQHAVDAARAERDAAEQRAHHATEAAAHAAGGLPEAQQWPQMRAHARAGLHEAVTRREQTVIDDQTECEQAAQQIPSLVQQVERLQQQRQDLRSELERRSGGDAPATAGPAHHAYLDASRHDVDRDHEHERG